jgi:DNA-binding MurR/RpiR family transcriptional regulator
MANAITRNSRRPAEAGTRKSGSAKAAPRKQGGDRGEPALGYTKPRTYEDLRAVLSSGTIHFPKRLRQVAIFLWQHPKDVALGTISQVAEQAGVQPSTLVRFAKIFGYAGFSDFQEIFKEHIKGSWPDAKSGNRPERGALTVDPHLHFVHGLVRASQASLGRIGEGFDAASFERMIELLADADLIYVIGSKRAFPVTAYMSLALSQQGVRNLLIDNVGSTAFDQVSCVGAKDTVLAVSFSPYNSITPDLVAAARERNARIVSITDSMFSPLVRLSDTWVEVIESDFAGFRSLAATLAVGMALVHGIAARRSLEQG